MAAKRSAGILLYRLRAGMPEVFLVHPGGPFWAKKDAGAWSIPKGEFEQGEDPLEHARREFLEETGSPINGEFRPLAPVKLGSGKTIFAWAVEGDIDADAIRSNLFSMEWPPRSGRQQEFPEIDRGGWFDLSAARRKLQEGQIALLDELAQRLSRPA
ncbi:MAG TPA: NUDIX domain-containing protein [Burkholderiales bacterium]|nr:NUDIX domain-containing protein [Burkholderiales bacterium]